MRAAVASDAPTASLRIGFILARAFTLSAFASCDDALRLAADDGDSSRPLRCRWQVMGSGLLPPRASCGLEVQPNSGFVDPADFDYVAVVGGLLQGGPQVDDAAMGYLRKAAAQGVPLIGVCTTTVANMPGRSA